MNIRVRNYKRWPCEIEPATDIESIRKMADANGLTYAELTRRLIRHSLRCSRFNPKRPLPAVNPTEINGPKEAE